MFNNNTEIEVRDKLTLLMLIHDIKVPLTNEKLSEMVLDSGLINYISMQHYVTELCELSMLETIPQEGKEHYLLTENGRIALDFFKVRIPVHIQEKIRKIIDEFNQQLPVETQVKASYERVSDEEYEVYLSISENSKHMMEVTIHVMSEKHAELICSKWNASATHYYGDILALLIQEKKTT